MQGQLLGLAVALEGTDCILGSDSKKQLCCHGLFLAIHLPILPRATVSAPPHDDASSLLPLVGWSLDRSAMQLFFFFFCPSSACVPESACLVGSLGSNQLQLCTLVGLCLRLARATQLCGRGLPVLGDAGRKCLTLNQGLTAQVLPAAVFC